MVQEYMTINNAWVDIWWSAKNMGANNSLPIFDI